MFIGDGDLKIEVLEYAKQNNIEEDILITGWVRDVENYIPALDIAILPSKWEGFGLAIIEYMACNKPIIATNIGGIADIIKNNENGFLVEVEDYRLIAKKINELLSEKKEVERIVKNNCKYKIKYDIKNLVKEHERIFVDE